MRKGKQRRFMIFTGPQPHGKAQLMKKLLFIGCCLLLLTGCSGAADPATPITPAPAPSGGTPVPSALVVWDLHGTVAGDGMLSGTLTYDADASPRAVNAHGLQPNALYDLTAWDLTLSPTAFTSQPIQWTQAASITNQELCLGECIFDPRLFQRVLVTDEPQLIQLLFIQGQMQLPRVNEDWGPLEPRGSYVQVISDTGEPLRLFMRSMTIVRHIEP